MTEHAKIRRIGKRLKVVYEEIDKGFATAVEKLGEPVSCRKHCTHCCHQVAVMSLFEALGIVAYLAEINRLFWIDNAWELMREQTRMLSDPKMDREKWYLLRQPCMFLGSEDLCLIYPVRPQACRTHVSLDDPDNCKPGYPGKIRSIDAEPAEMYMLGHGTKHMEQFGVVNAMLPIPVAMAWAHIAWTKGIDALKATIAKTPWGRSELEGIASWMHLLRNHPSLKDRVEITEMPDGRTRIEFKMEEGAK